jgi:hypothetical protein
MGWMAGLRGVGSGEASADVHYVLQVVHYFFKYIHPSLSINAKVYVPVAEECVLEEVPLLTRGPRRQHIHRHLCNTRPERQRDKRGGGRRKDGTGETQKYPRF